MADLFRYTSPQLHFGFEPGSFEEDLFDGMTVLSVPTPSQEQAFASVLLNEEMKRGKKYFVTFRFRVASEATSLRLFALDTFGGNPELVFEFDPSEVDPEVWQEEFVEFTPEKAGHWHLGIDARDLVGPSNGLIVDTLTVREEDTTERTIAGLQKKIDDLKKTLEVNQYQQNLLFWGGYKRDDESMMDAKLRFFRSLEPADEETRLLQRTTTLLLREFARICEKHGIDYWIDFGTLLGAVRHGGFVPWDDDIDVCMLRKDIPTLAKAVAEEDTFIKFTQYYCIGGGIYNITRIMFDDPHIKLFVDIFIFDYAQTDNFHETWMSYRRQRKIMCDDTRKFRPVTRKDPLLDRWEVNAVIIDEHISEIDSIRESLDPKMDIREDSGNYVIWSVDNVGYPIGHYGIRPVEYIFPLQEIEFEGYTFKAPAQPIPVLEGRYGDPFALPRDILGHNHIQRKAGFADKCRELLDKYE